MSNDPLRGVGLPSEQAPLPDMQAAEQALGVGDGNDRHGENAAAFRALWSTAEATRVQQAEVVQELNALALVGEGSLFSRGPHVPVGHMAFFKPEQDSFLTTLRSKDRRSAKEWEYINSAGVWADFAICSLQIARTTGGDEAVMAKRLALAEEAMKAAREVLMMRAQYFRDINEHGVETARQMSFLVEQTSDPVFSDAHRHARDTLNAKIEIEAAKVLAKARVQGASSSKKKKKGRNAGAGSDQSE